MKRFVWPLLALCAVVTILLIVQSQTNADRYAPRDGSDHLCTFALAATPSANVPNDPTYGADVSKCIEGGAPNAWNLSHPCYIDGGGAYGAFYDKSGKFVGNGRLKCREYAPDMPGATDGGSIFSRTPGPDASPAPAPSALYGPSGGHIGAMALFMPAARYTASAGDYTRGYRAGYRAGYRHAHGIHRHRAPRHRRVIHRRHTTRRAHSAAYRAGYRVGYAAGKRA